MSINENGKQIKRNYTITCACLSGTGLIKTLVIGIYHYKPYHWTALCGTGGDTLYIKHHEIEYFVQNYTNENYDKSEFYSDCTNKNLHKLILTAAALILYVDLHCIKQWKYHCLLI